MNKINLKKINWEKSNGLVPAIVQDSKTNLVLMLGYLNKEALTKTLATKKVWFYSRTKERLWMKGETSGNFLTALAIKFDCDGDTLLIKAAPNGPTCHTGRTTCFNEKENSPPLLELFGLIADRKKKLPKKSYTTSLFNSGLDKILLKVAEESMEVVHAASKQTRKRLTEETVDLIYHLFVLLAEKNISIDEINAEIIKRRK